MRQKATILGAALLALSAALAPQAGAGGLVEEFFRLGPERRPIQLVVALDLSSSNPLVRRGDTFAATAGEQVASLVYPAAFPPGSRITIKSFGARGSDQIPPTSVPQSGYMRGNAAQLSAMVNGARPLIERVIAGIPERIASRQLRAEPYTNIMGLLDDELSAVNCGIRTHIVLVSDGVESRQAGGGESGALLETRLPQGCEVTLTVLGFARGLGTEEARALRARYVDWAREAGFARVVLARESGVLADQLGFPQP